MVIRKLTSAVTGASLDQLHANHPGCCDSCGTRPEAGETIGIYYSDLNLLAPDDVELQPHHLYCQSCLPPELRYPTVNASEFLLTARLKPAGGEQPHRKPRPQESLVFADVNVIDTSLESEGHPWSILDVWNTFGTVSFAALQEHMDRPFGPETLVDVLYQSGVDLNQVLGPNGEIIVSEPQQERLQQQVQSVAEAGNPTGSTRSNDRLRMADPSDSTSEDPATGLDSPSDPQYAGLSQRGEIKSDGLGVAGTTPVPQQQATQPDHSPRETESPLRAESRATAASSPGADRSSLPSNPDREQQRDDHDPATVERQRDFDGTIMSSTVLVAANWPPVTIISHSQKEGTKSEVWAFLVLESGEEKTALPIGAAFQNRQQEVEPLPADSSLAQSVKEELADQGISRIATPRRA